MLSKLQLSLHVFIFTNLNNCSLTLHGNLYQISPRSVKNYGPVRVGNDSSPATVTCDCPSEDLAAVLTVVWRLSMKNRAPNFIKIREIICHQHCLTERQRKWRTDGLMCSPHKGCFSFQRTPESNVNRVINQFVSVSRAADTCLSAPVHIHFVSRSLPTVINPPLNLDSFGGHQIQSAHAQQLRACVALLV